MTVKYPVKREHWFTPPTILPSGLKVIHIGRRSIQCEAGLHRFQTKNIMGIPYLSCQRCGFLSPKPVLEHTISRRELIERTQKAMDKDQPVVFSSDPKIAEKQREELIIKVWEKHQRNAKR